MQFLWVLSSQSCFVFRFVRLSSSSSFSSLSSSSVETSTTIFGKRIILMGRSGKGAPRICSTFELRTHAPSSSSSSSMALTLLPPPSSTDALSSKPVCSSPPPPSPDTPGQTPPASVKPQAWPQDVLELMQQQVKVLSSYGSSDGVNEAGKRKRDCPDIDDEEEEAVLKKKQCEEAGAGGIEVELHTQSPLPEDWEQFLDLKSGELYYFHWRSCKRAKKDPRELVRQVDESVRALVLNAQARFTPNSSPDIGCLKEEKTPAQASPGEVESADSKEQKTSKCDNEEESRREMTGMVALGCRHCSMFVMLSLSFPSCPSCGEQSLRADHDRDG